MDFPVTIPTAEISEDRRAASHLSEVLPRARGRIFVPETVAARIALIFTPLALAAIFVFFLLYSTQLAATQNVIASGQKQLVEVGLTTLSTTLATLDNDAKFIADQPLLQEWLTSGARSDRELLLEQFLSFVRHRGLYDQVRFIGLDGREQMRVDWNNGTPMIVPDAQLQDKSDRYYVRQSLAVQAGHNYFSAFDLNVEGGAIEQPIKPAIRIGAPVYGLDGTKRGIVVLNYQGQRALDRVRNLSTQGLGQAWLVDARGYWLLGPTPGDEWGFMYPNSNKSFAQAYPDAWKRIAPSSQSGQFATDGALFSYAPITLPDGVMTGQDTLVAASTAPSWFLVTRSPASTYSQIGLDLARQYLIALAGVLLVLGAISWVIASNSVRRRMAERQVRALNQRLARENVALESVNRELESFSYSVSHDLRAPLRSIDGFSKALLEDYADALDATGQDYLKRVRSAAQRMGDLIDDLIKLARVTRSELASDSVDLSLLARRVAADLSRGNADRKVEFSIEPDLTVQGDFRLLQIVLENLIGNSWKFTSKKPEAVIAFGQAQIDGEVVYFVRDNGAGFNMAHANKLFGVFQRLHAISDFDGTGIGLATVQRIVYKHGGRVWGEAEQNRGATFHFTLRAGARDNETNPVGRG
jgi:signal transduction histidine kinase